MGNGKCGNASQQLSDDTIVCLNVLACLNDTTSTVNHIAEQSAGGVEAPGLQHLQSAAADAGAVNLSTTRPVILVFCNAIPHACCFAFAGQVGAKNAFGVLGGFAKFLNSAGVVVTNVTLA